MMNAKKIFLNLIAVSCVALVSSSAFAALKNTSFVAQCPAVSNFPSHGTHVYSTVNNNTITWKGYNGVGTIQSFNGALFSSCSASNKTCSVSCKYTAKNKNGSVFSITLTPLNNSHLLLSPISSSEDQTGICTASDPAQCQFDVIENDLTQTNTKPHSF